MDSGLLSRYAQLQTDIQQQQAPQLAQSYLDVQKVYGPQMISLAMDNLKTADPSGFALREKLGTMALDDLSLGGALSPEEQRNLQQDLRAGQVSRGVGTGFSDAIDEARYLGNQRYTRREQAKADAASFLAGTPPQASFASLNQAGQTAPVGTQNINGVMGSVMPSTNQLISSQMNGYGIWADSINNANALNSRNYWNQFDRGSNPFLTGLGVASSLAGTAAGIAACWVAETLYGKDDTRTQAIREYVRRHMFDEGPLGAFCRTYHVFGELWAKLISVNAEAREKAKAHWDQLYEAAKEEMVCPA